MLLGAGIGSITSNRWKITPGFRWFVPFIGIFFAMILLFAVYPIAQDTFLAASLATRVTATIFFIFLVSFFLGMPFPLGILSLQHQPKGSVAWAWGMNGLFTVIGGLLGIVSSIQWGFKITLWIAWAIYALAFFIFSSIRSTL